MQEKLRPLLYLVPVAASGALAFSVLAAPGQSPLDLLRRPCSAPLEYGVGAYDPRFGISEEEFSEHIDRAASVWNEASGRTLLRAGEKPDVSVNLFYDERQRAVETGQVIEGEQAEYRELRAGVEELRARYRANVASYEESADAFTTRADRLEERVAYWNERGGAPPDEYAELEGERRALEREEAALRAEASAANRLGRELEAAIDRLNALAAATNEKVEEYNDAVDEDFDQGNYVSDRNGRRITIFEFANEAELERVLAHEFGHALGIGHTEDPESVMYSYNVGTGIELAEEDLAALREACSL